jgi:segregation and condensation protein B
MENQLTSSRIIEAILFASDAPVETDRLIEISGLTGGEPALYSVIEYLNGELAGSGRVFRVVEVAGGYQLETLPQYGSFIEKLFRSRSRPRLSRAALETIAIVAYKQPISKAEIEAVRGVDSDASIRTLQNRELVEVKGRGESAGKPILYGTTVEFLRYFGLKDISDLPGADELASMFDGTEFVEAIPEQLSFETAMIPGEENQNSIERQDSESEGGNIEA